jgi:hypothetical protein
MRTYTLLLSAGLGLTLITVASVPAHAKNITLLNVSYDPTRELYQDVNTAFAKFWKQKTSDTVTINQSQADLPRPYDDPPSGGRQARPKAPACLGLDLTHNQEYVSLRIWAKPAGGTHAGVRDERGGCGRDALARAVPPRRKVDGSAPHYRVDPCAPGVHGWTWLGHRTASTPH